MLAEHSSEGELIEIVGDQSCGWEATNFCLFATGYLKQCDEREVTAGRCVSLMDMEAEPLCEVPRRAPPTSKTESAP
jgi:hypothetical protein